MNNGLRGLIDNVNSTLNKEIDWLNVTKLSTNIENTPLILGTIVKSCE